MTLPHDGINNKNTTAGKSPPLPGAVVQMTGFF